MSHTPRALINLTSAQRSAIECSGADEIDQPVLDAALCVGVWALIFDAAQREPLAAELTDLANAEDHYAQQGDAGARGARTALTNLARAVRRAALE